MEYFILIFTGKGAELDVIQVAARAIIVFILTISLLKAGKKRFLGKNSPLDIILAVIIGSVISRAINGSATLLSSISACLALILFHWLLSYFTTKSKWFSKYLNGIPHPLMLDGKIIEESLKHHHMKEEDIKEAARLKANVSDLNKIKEAYLESNGSISVVKKSNLSSQS